MTTLTRPLGGLLGGGIVESILGADASAAVWTPGTQSGTTLVWERADSLTASPVSSYPDRSGGHTATQATGTKQPAWHASGPGGQPYITLVSANAQSLATGSFASGIGTGDFAAGVVFRTSTVTGALALFGFAGAQMLFVSNNRMDYFFSASGHLFTAAPANGAWHHAVLFRTAGVAHLLFDGVADATTIADASSWGTGVWEIGAFGGLDNFNGDQAELWLSKGTFTAADQAGYLTYIKRDGF